MTSTSATSRAPSFVAAADSNAQNPLIHITGDMPAHAHDTDDAQDMLESNMPEDALEVRDIA